MFLKPGKFSLEFIAFSIISMISLLSVIFLPFASSEIMLGRIYIYVMIVLAPLCVFGALLCRDWIARLVKSTIVKRTGMSILVLLIFIPYFLYTSYFVFAFSSQPSSQALGPYRMDHWALFTQSDTAAAAWLQDKQGMDFSIYGDYGSYTLLKRHLYWVSSCIPFSGELPANGFVLLRSWNVLRDEMFLRRVSMDGRGVTYVHLNLMLLPGLTARLDNSPLVYTNGNASIIGPDKSP
jgi:uncharacterized membrane protein